VQSRFCTFIFYSAFLKHFAARNGRNTMAYCTADISNQIISWTDVAISAIMYGVVFLPFLAAKCYRKNK
jgi:hypothetical protein